MYYPKISIVTPNFNGGKYLEQTIQSVLSQDYPNLEYIVIDGCSTDNSVAIIKKYESQLAYWVSEPDKGMYEAIQKGFDHSNGEIMAWINSDDLYHPKAFFTVAEIFNFKEVHWLQGIPSFFDENGRVIAVESLKQWSKLDFYLGNYKWIQQESVFWRRTLWEISGEKVDVKMKYAGDLELWLRFFRHEKLYVTKALIGGFRMRSQEQLSLDFYQEYVDEAKLKIKYELENHVSKEESYLIKKISRYNSMINKIQNNFLRKLITKIFYTGIIKEKQLYFGNPPVIIFDRISQKFRINN